MNEIPISKANKMEYQKLFDEIILKIDVSPYERWLNGEPEKKTGEFEKETEKLTEILSEAEAVGLDPVVLYVIFLQYTKADVYQREISKHDWVEAILHRKDEDFFPSFDSILFVLTKMGYLQ